MRTSYLVYNAGIPSGGWKWQHPTEVYVLYGPVTELVMIRTRNSVGSRRCPHVREHYVGWGDSRYHGPRSAYGQALEQAHAWAQEQGYVDARPAIDAWTKQARHRPRDERRLRSLRASSTYHRECMDQLIGLGVHPRHAHLATRKWGYVRSYTSDEACQTAQPILALYRLGVKITPATMRAITGWSGEVVTPSHPLLAHRPDLAVRVRIETAQGIHHPPTWLLQVA